jgi:hypothetical protein
MRASSGWSNIHSAVTMTALLALGLPNLASASAASSPLHEAIRQALPRYDPEVRAKHLAAIATAGTSEQNPPQPETPNADTDKPVVSLPRIIVRPTEDQSKTPAVTLPRVVVRPPPNDVKAEPFLTPAAHDAALVKKHFTSLDRNFLNRFTLPLFGRSRESRAREAERIEATGKQLNAIADLIQREESQSGDPADEEQLKKLYLELYMARPK